LFYLTEMNQSVVAIKYNLHKLIRDLYEKKDAAITEVERLEIQSEINAIYDKIENLCLIGDN
jgi:hypothetical protein